MRAKVVLCNCKGLCPSFQQADMNTLPFHLESELDVEYSVLHPQLCGQGGNAVLGELMSEAARDPDTVLFVGACAPEAQQKLFKKLMRSTGLRESQFVPIDIRGTDNDGIVERLRKEVAKVVADRSSAAKPSATEPPSPPP